MMFNVWVRLVWFCFYGKEFCSPAAATAATLSRLSCYVFFSRIIPICVFRFFCLVHETRGGLVMRRLGLVFAVMMWTTGWVHRVAISFRCYFWGDGSLKAYLVSGEHISLEQGAGIGPPAPPKKIIPT